LKEDDEEEKEGNQAELDKTSNKENKKKIE
jgi:hypothetical protein